MDPRSSFRLPGEKLFGAKGPAGKPPHNFKTLRRLHGQNLESRGLNDLTEAFQTFVTRARFFSIGKLRRTWSHSAAEFMKYRRLLPMLLADGQAFDNDETNDAFDAVLSFQASQKDDRRIIVTNISPRVTASQLQSFFSKYGKVVHCSLPREEPKKSSPFATLTKTVKNCGTAVITFKKPEEAEKAKAAPDEELKFYDQIMKITSYASKKKGGKGVVLSDDKDESRLSRASSTQSLSSQMSTSGYEGSALNVDLLPPKILERVIAFLPITETIRLERLNKKWMEASVKSWTHINSLPFSRETDGRGRGFTKQNPLLTSHLKAILRRGGAHLKSVDLSGVVHLLDDRALTVIAEMCPNLKSLDLSGVSASWQAFAELGDTLTGLEKIAFREMSSITDKHIWFLVRGSAKNLRFVDFRGCRRIRGRCFRLFGHRLEQLYLDGCTRVDEMAIEDLCTNSSQLKELRLNDCYRITDSCISMISRTMSDLQAITLCGDGFKELSSSGLSHLSRITGLVEIAFDYNPLVCDKLIGHLVENAKGLRCVSLANSGSDQSISTDGLRKIANLRELEQIDLSSLAAVRSPVLADLCSKCTKLELIQMRNCVYLCDDGVVHVKKAQKLKHLDLSGSILITSNSIQEIIKAFPSTTGFSTITIVVGGTVAETGELRVRGSRVAIDFSDYSALVGMANSQSATSSYSLGDSDDDVSEDDFDVLTAQRSFYIDAVCGEDDSPVLESETEILEWATKEAKNLGLIKP
ncbi:unnamed protein product, partial [Mesorhabditis belari]|uniref:RNA-binding protein EEED8.10 n=1 Tax=Mesorhabditis belari TaxID=2138241 RepID=A0AAF3EID6_9BILA